MFCQSGHTTFCSDEWISDRLEHTIKKSNQNSDSQFVFSTKGFEQGEIDGLIRVIFFENKISVANLKSKQVLGFDTINTSCD